MLTFLVLLLAYVLSQFFRSFLAIVAGELSADLDLGAADLGAVSAIWFAAFALAQFPVGWALDRFGPRRTLALFMVLAAVGAYRLAQAQD
ncbi:MAG TPA: MFS transporter, partial [Microvirga sp.]|nr:MFS transporter [Microvirga sp.]